MHIAYKYMYEADTLAIKTASLVVQLENELL